MRFVNKFIILLSFLFVSAASASGVAYIAGYQFSLEFPPHEKVKLQNPVFWANRSSCTFYSEAKLPAQFEVTLLSHSASIDGHSLPTKVPTQMTVLHKQRLSIKVSGSASVRLINLSDATVHANCA